MPPKNERRNFPRVPAPQGAGAILKAAISAHIVDVSAKGMQLESTSPLRPGSECHVRAMLGESELNVVVVVTRCKAEGTVGDGRGGRLMLYQLGAEISKMTPADEKILAAWLTREAGAKLQASIEPGSEN